MATSSQNPPTVPARGQYGLSTVALVLGCCGIIFYNIAPFGIILSCAGLCFAIAAWFTAAARAGVGVGVAAAATCVCILALVIDVLIYTNGLSSFVRPY